MLHLPTVIMGGFIGGCIGVRTAVGLGQQGCKGGAKKSNSEIWHNFQGFSFFEVKLKLIHNSMPISQEMAFLGF
jgi:hypothetical protein